MIRAKSRHWTQEGDGFTELSDRATPWDTVIMGFLLHGPHRSVYTDPSALSIRTGVSGSGPDYPYLRESL